MKQTFCEISEEFLNSNCYFTIHFAFLYFHIWFHAVAFQYSDEVTALSSFPFFKVENCFYQLAPTNKDALIQPAGGALSLNTLRQATF